MTAEKNERVVYLEDVQPKSQSRNSDTSSASSVVPTTQVPKAAVTAVPTGGAKRQRTLMDMMGGGSRESGSDAKKIRLSAAASSSAASSSKAKSFGLQKLSAIPFDLAAFQESLPEEQKALLRLECEAMGQSWYIFRNSTLRRA
jgi:hypothetical protein